MEKNNKAIYFQINLKKLLKKYQQYHIVRELGYTCAQPNSYFELFENEYSLFILRLSTGEFF